MKGTHLSTLPHHSIANKHRYGELASPNLEELMKIYRAALEVSVELTGKLTRRFHFNNVQFQIKLPPWMKPGD